MIRLLLKKQSDLGIPCLSRAFWQITSVRNFRTVTVFIEYCNHFGMTLHLWLYNLFASSEGSGQTVLLPRLVQHFTVC